MQKELRLWQFIAERLSASQQIILLIVAESDGSSPGRQGFKMAIDENNRYVGSIGGGIMEIKLVELAKAQLKQQAAVATLKKQVHRKDAPQHQSGMICSGEQTILFVPFTPKQMSLVQRIIQLVTSYQPVQLIVSYNADNQYYISAEITEGNHPTAFEAEPEGTYFYQESLGFKHFLYIVGGGHCSLALSELLVRLDFHVTVLDDRPTLDTLAANTYAHQVIRLEDYHQVGIQIPYGGNIYVVIMTVGYRTDDIVMRQLLHHRIKYLGMLGSKNKIATLLLQLRANGYEEAQLSRLHAPIGLPIHSKTPEEIAVSIAAEIIKEKNSP